MANPFPFTAGQVLTAAQLNGIGEAWTSYTPTITQGAAITKTITYAKWARVNKIVVVEANIALTSAGTASNALTLTLPIAPATSGIFSMIGSAMFYKASTTLPYILAAVYDSGSLKFWHETAGGNFFGAVPAVTVANGDNISFQLIYEVA